jgi:hypothetical protein
LLGTVSTIVGQVGGPPTGDVGGAVTGLGTTLAAAGGGVSGVGGLTGTLGNVVQKVGTEVSTTGSGLTGSGLAGLPLVGNTLGGVITSVDGTLNSLLGVTVMNRQISGSPTSDGLLNASVLSHNIATGAPVSASVLSGGQVLNLNGSNVLGGLTAGTTAGGVGGLLGGVTNTVSGLTGGLTAGTTAGGAGGLVGGVVNTVTGVVGGVTGGLGK